MDDRLADGQIIRVGRVDGVGAVGIYRDEDALGNFSGLPDQRIVAIDRRNRQAIGNAVLIGVAGVLVEIVGEDIAGADFIFQNRDFIVDRVHREGRGAEKLVGIFAVAIRFTDRSLAYGKTLERDIVEGQAAQTG